MNSSAEPRLVLAQRPTRRDHLHGSWWPRSTDLDHELAPMLRLVVERYGAVVLGVSVNRDEWPGATGAGHSTFGKIKMSWYGLSEPHLVVLFCTGGRRLSLLLLGPDLPEQVAVMATLMASTPGNTLGTDELLVAARERVRAA